MDNRTIEEVRKNETKLINEIKVLEQQCKRQKEVIDKANKKLNNFIDCCKAEKLESGSDYIHHQYWDMFERFNKQIKEYIGIASSTTSNNLLVTDTLEILEKLGLLKTEIIHKDEKTYIQFLWVKNKLE